VGGVSGFLFLKKPVESAAKRTLPGLGELVEGDWERKTSGGERN